MLLVEHRWLVPGLLADDKPAAKLGENTESDLAQKRDEDFATDKACSRSLLAELRVRTRPTHEDGDGQDEQQVDVQELEVAEVTSGGVEEAH